MLSKKRIATGFIGLLTALSAPQFAGAAVPKTPIAQAPNGKAVLVDVTREALALPIGNRLAALQGQGPQGYRNLISIMFDPKMPMEMRWRAVTAAGRIGGPLSRPELEKALAGNDWYMRNAGLVAMVSIDRQVAASWARKLLSDKALVVRAAAVDVIADLKDTGSTTVLWEKLYAKENFRGSQSLYVRRRIVEALAQMETKGKEERFIRVLADADPALHPPAIAALERLTGEKLGTPKDPMSFKKEHWQKWWKENAQAKM